MGCGCTKNKRVLSRDPSDIKGGYKYLKPSQLKARLEVFKRNNCQDCEKRYKCDYDKYLTCKGQAPNIS